MNFNWMKNEKQNRWRNKNGNNIRILISVKCVSTKSERPRNLQFDMILFALLLVFQLVSLSFAALSSLHNIDEASQLNPRQYVLEPLPCEIPSNNELLSQPIPTSTKMFESFPVKILIIICSFIPNFSIISQYNRRLMKVYETHREKLIQERLDGFNPGENY